MMNPWKKMYHQVMRQVSFKKSFQRQPLSIQWMDDRSHRPRSYHTHAQEGYAQNPIVYRAVTLIARSVASVPWVLFDTNHRLDHHPLLTLLNRPNPLQGGAAWMESVVSYLLLSGNSYLQLVGEGQAAEMYTLRPDRMTMVVGQDGFLKGYQYRAHPQQDAVWFPYQNNPQDNEIVHLKMFHPSQDTYGMSPLEAAALSVDQHNGVSQHNLALLQQGGRPTGALMVRSSGQGPFHMTAEQRQDLKRQVRETFSGAQNAGRILVLEGDMEWKEMGISLKDLDYIAGKNLSAREIAQVFGVPPMLVGVPGDSTFANYREARLHFWEDTVLPLLDSLTDEVNRWLVPRYGDGLRLSYDTDAIPALSPKREVVWGKIAHASFLTLNEKRHAIGYPPLPDGDRLDLMGKTSAEREDAF